MLDLILTCTGLVICAGLMVLGNWRASKPRNDLAKIRVPWIPVMLAAAFVAFLLFIHLVNLAGIDTAAQGGRFG
jgi:high-affinity Fe2+/Pb2+ permease